MWRRIGSNSLANLSAGVSATVYQIGLTAIASRNFEPGLFSIWALALSLSSLVPLFAANLSTAVTRRLLESKPERAGAILQSSQRLARLLSLIAVTAIGLTAVLLHEHSQPLQAINAGSFLALVILLVCTQLWNVLLQPQFGSEYASEHNWKVARVISSARIGGLTGIGLACISSAKDSLTLVSIGLLLGTCGGLITSGLKHHSLQKATTSAIEEETAQMLPLIKAFAVWSVGTAAIQYGLPAIISLLAPSGFNAFYFAYTLNLIVVGTIGSAASALLTPLTRQRLNGSTRQLERILVIAPIGIGLTLVALLLVIWFTLPEILSIWSAQMVSPEAVRGPFFWLALQTTARSMTVVHAVLLSSAGSPGRMTLPTLLEVGLMSLVALPFGWHFGGTIFLAIIAAAGLAAALYTAWTTLNLGLTSKKSRSRLISAFVGAQALALGLWTLSTQ